MLALGFREDFFFFLLITFCWGLRPFFFFSLSNFIQVKQKTFLKCSELQLVEAAQVAQEMAVISTSFSYLAAFVCQQNHRFVLVSGSITGTKATRGNKWFLSCYIASYLGELLIATLSQGKLGGPWCRRDCCHLSCSARPACRGGAGCDPAAGKRAFLTGFSLLSQAVFSTDGM